MESLVVSAVSRCCVARAAACSLRLARQAKRRWRSVAALRCESILGDTRQRRTASRAPDSRVAPPGRTCRGHLCAGCARELSRRRPAARCPPVRRLRRSSIRVGAFPHSQNIIVIRPPCQLWPPIGADPPPSASSSFRVVRPRTFFLSLFVEPSKHPTSLHLNTRRVRHFTRMQRGGGGALAITTAKPLSRTASRAEKLQTRRARHLCSTVVRVGAE